MLKIRDNEKRKFFEIRIEKQRKTLSYAGWSKEYKYQEAVLLYHKLYNERTANPSEGNSSPLQEANRLSQDNHEGN